MSEVPEVEEVDDFYYDSLFQQIADGTINKLPVEVEQLSSTGSYNSFDLSTPMGVYDALNHGRSVTLCFPNKAAADKYRIRLAQIKSRKDKSNRKDHYYETDSLLFRHNPEEADYTVDISFGKRGKADYSFTVVEISDG